MLTDFVKIRSQINHKLLGLFSGLIALHARIACIYGSVQWAEVDLCIQIRSVASTHHVHNITVISLYMYKPSASIISRSKCHNQNTKTRTYNQLTAIYK